MEFLRAHPSDAMVVAELLEGAKKKLILGYFGHQNGNLLHLIQRNQDQVEFQSRKADTSEEKADESLG